MLWGTMNEIHHNCMGGKAQQMKEGRKICPIHGRIPTWIGGKNTSLCKLNELILGDFLQKRSSIAFCWALMISLSRSGFRHQLCLKIKCQGCAWKMVRSWHLLCSQRLLKSQGLYYSCLPCWCHSSCCCCVFLIACVYWSDDLSLCQAAVFNPGQLPSYPAVFTAC